MMTADVLKGLSKRGYKVTEAELQRYADKGWCPASDYDGWPQETIEELVASFELEKILKPYRVSC
jgi:hypothetical protein